VVTVLTVKAELLKVHLRPVAGPHRGNCVLAIGRIV